MKNFIKQSILLLLILSLSSCSEIVTNKADSDGMARISFSTLSRTLNPTFSIDEENYVKAVFTATPASGRAFTKEWTPDKDSTLLNTVIKDESIELSPGEYDFTLEFYAKTSVSDEHLALVASLKEKLESGYNRLEFPLEWAASGDVKITFEWVNDENISDLNVIEGIKAGLFTFESDGQTPVKGYDFKDLEIVTSDDGCSADFVGKSVPAGIYYIKYIAYHKNLESFPLVYGAKGELIKINGYQTEHSINISYDDLNSYINVKYRLDGGSWTDSPSTTAHDAIVNSDIIDYELPDSSMIKKDDFIFLGWVECDNDGNPLSDTAEPITDNIVPSFELRDYYFKACWKNGKNQLSDTTVNLDDKNVSVNEIEVNVTESGDNQDCVLKAILPNDASVLSRFYWFLDGVLQTEQSDTFTINKDLLSMGVHQITVTVDCGDDSYAGEHQLFISRTSEPRYVFVSSDKGLEFRLNRLSTDKAFENVGIIEKESQFSLRMVYEKSLNGWTGCWPFVNAGQEYTFSINGGYGDSDETWYNPTELPAVTYTGSKKSGFTENTLHMFEVYNNQVATARDLADSDGSVGISVTFEPDGIDLANLFADIDGVETTKSKLIISVIKPSGEWVMSTEYSEEGAIPEKLTDYDFVSVLDENDWSRNCLLENIKSGDEYVVCVSAAYYFDGNTDVCFELPLIKTEVITRK